MKKKKKVLKQLIGIAVSSDGIDVSYLIDGVQKKINVSGTHYTDVSLVTSDLNELAELNDRELAESTLVLVRSIAYKWEEFRESAIFHHNYEKDRLLEAEQKAITTTAVA